MRWPLEALFMRIQAPTRATPRLHYGGARQPNGPTSQTVQFPQQPRPFRDYNRTISSNDGKHIEIRVKEALIYIQEFPNTRNRTMCRKLDIPRGRLNRRLQGRGPRIGRPASHANPLAD